MGGDSSYSSLFLHLGRERGEDGGGGPGSPAGVREPLRTGDQTSQLQAERFLLRNRAENGVGTVSQGLQETCGSQHSPPAGGASCHTPGGFLRRPTVGGLFPGQKAETAPCASEPTAAGFYPLRCLDGGDPGPTRCAPKDSRSPVRWL